MNQQIYKNIFVLESIYKIRAPNEYISSQLHPLSTKLLLLSVIFCQCSIILRKLPCQFLARHDTRKVIRVYLEIALPNTFLLRSWKEQGKQLTWFVHYNINLGPCIERSEGVNSLHCCVERGSCRAISSVGITLMVDQAEINQLIKRATKQWKFLASGNRQSQELSTD